MINLKLAEKQELDMRAIYYIGVLHERCSHIEKEMSMYSPDSEDFHEFQNIWNTIQFDLQKLWGFERDHTRHPTWTLPHCTCPKMDNADMGEHMYFAEDCPLHASNTGDEQK